MTSPRCPVMVNCLPPRIRVASMKMMSPPTGVQTSPTATPGRLTRSSTSFSVRNFGTPRNSRTTSGVTIIFSILPSAMRRACFPREAVDDLLQPRVLEFDLFADFQPVFRGLFRDQIFVRDVQLLLARVAGQFDDLHAVAQRLRDGVHPVGRGNEQYLGKIERHIEVVIAERVVLLWIENFHQRR